MLRLLLLLSPWRRRGAVRPAQLRVDGRLKRRSGESDRRRPLPGALLDVCPLGQRHPLFIVAACTITEAGLQMVL